MFPWVQLKYKTYTVQHSDDDYRRLNGRCLAAISEKVPSSRKKILAIDPDLSKISNLFSHPVEDVKGNCALVISNCIQLVDCDKHSPVAVIPQLISTVDLAKNEKTRKNAAIALSKAAGLTDECREVFRKHHGLEILRSRISQIKL